MANDKFSPRAELSPERREFLGEDMGFDTLSVRAGQVRSQEGEHAESLFLTSSYVFNSAEDAAARFSGESVGNVYSRYTNPTVRTFEARLAALEGADAAVATASGMSAILTYAMSSLQAGDHVVCSQNVFGTTVNLFSVILAKFGIQVSFVPLKDLSAWQKACEPNTKMFFAETPSNPLNELVDVKALSEIAHEHSAKLVIDNTYLTPVFQKPLGLGADVVIYSATKFLDGQGRCTGGAIVADQETVEACVGFLRTCGPTMSPFNAWVLLKGLETLRLRMEAAEKNAVELAKWLDQQSWVDRVYHTSLESHPHHELAKQQQTGFGSVLAFEVQGGREQAWKVINATRLLSLTANLGDVKSTIVHPATTTHGRLSDAQRKEAGIQDNLIRISVGIESLEDIQQDLLQGAPAKG